MVRNDIRGVAAPPHPMVLDGMPAAREVVDVVAVCRIRDILVLSNVQRLRVGFAISRVIAHGLHAKLCALGDHDAGKRPGERRSGRNLENVARRRDAVFLAEVGAEVRFVESGDGDPPRRARRARSFRRGHNARRKTALARICALRGWIEPLIRAAFTDVLALGGLVLPSGTCNTGTFCLVWLNPSAWALFANGALRTSDRLVPPGRAIYAA